MSFFQKPSREAATEGRLLARPMQQTETEPQGLQKLALDSDLSDGNTGGDRDGLLYVPKGYRANQAATVHFTRKMGPRAVDRSMQSKNCATATKGGI